MPPVLYDNNYLVVRTPDYVTIPVEVIHDARTVRLNAKHVPEIVRQWFGDSAGHRDGDTLVVETTNFNGQTRFRGSSGDRKVTERFTRVDANAIVYRAAMEDASTWTLPWAPELPLVAANAPIHPYSRHEGNYAIRDFLGPDKSAQRSAGG